MSVRACQRVCISLPRALRLARARLLAAWLRCPPRPWGRLRPSLRVCGVGARRGLPSVLFGWLHLQTSASSFLRRRASPPWPPGRCGEAWGECSLQGRGTRRGQRGW